MDVYQKIIEDLKNKYEKDDNALAFFIAGSVARGEAQYGNDLDTIFITREGSFSEEYEQDGILVEIGGNTFDTALQSLEKNPMQLYIYQDAKAVFDKENCLKKLKEKADKIFRNYKPDEAELTVIKKWLSSVVKKVEVAQQNNDHEKVGFHVSNVLWKTVEGLYAINSIPTPAATSALRRINSLSILPEDFERLWNDALLGDLTTRTNATIKLMKFVLAKLI